jgi:hypothetical protein
MPRLTTAVRSIPAERQSGRLGAPASNANAHSGYDVPLAASQEPDRAIAEFKHALELRGDLGDVRLALAGLLGRAGRAPEALGEIRASRG